MIGLIRSTCCVFPFDQIFFCIFQQCSSFRYYTFVQYIPSYFIFSVAIIVYFFAISSDSSVCVKAIDFIIFIYSLVNSHYYSSFLFHLVPLAFHLQIIFSLLYFYISEIYFVKYIRENFNTVLNSSSELGVLRDLILFLLQCI